ncbi:scavenger receptor class B member 1-like [Maniola jurtina]|uniref:scavenger receptor class B member 1-like n=1 Tax=Maniola jurtina TaxID=191418 RepID=UPI001E68EA2C|nr:scavenger receptor class B member 1-like [Maniola jurtina]XP_045767521.1 scavenger receptor class B member 1-like [Maniola jurtina]
MVLGAKKAMQHVPSKGRISIMRIQNFTVQKRQSVIRAVYGSFLIVFAVVLVAADPATIVTNWYLDVQEGKLIYRMWNKPTYEVFSEVFVFNYTNVDQYLSGDDNQLQLEEIGPFLFREIRENENITIDRDRGVMTMNPTLRLEFLPDESVAHYKDVQIMVPNVALLAISTLLADNTGYFVNVGAYYSITALGSKLFRNMTAGELLWGYDDPLVSLASKLLPGWIDFGKIGILDRFYAPRKEEVEVELKNLSRKFSINTWNGLTGLPEQGFSDWNTSIPCNQVKGTYEALMLTPGLNKDLELPVFRKQACRTYPFTFLEEVTGPSGFKFYRYMMAESSFNKTSRYACDCTKNCLPDGFVDISSCYYGFPITLSKPHFLDVDPVNQGHYRGFSPDPIKHRSILDVEPVSGVNLAVTSNIQINIAVRTSAGNPITKPFKNKVVPILWFSLYCREAPSEVINLLWLRLVLAPPLIITVAVLLLVVGMILGIQGFYRIWRPRYKLVQKEQKTRKKSVEKRRNSVVLNMSDNDGFDEQELAKEAVSLLAITEEDGDGTSDLLLNADMDRYT